MSKIRHLSWDDYLFQNRHKAYGAYALRTGEGQNLLKSLLITIGGIFAISLILSFTVKEKVKITDKDIYSPTFILGKVDDEQPPRIKPELPTVAKVIPPAKTNEELDSDIMPEPTSDPAVETPINKNENLGKTETDETGETSEGMGASQVGSTTEGNIGNGTGEGSGVETPVTPAQPDKIFLPRDVSKMAIFPGCEKAGKSKIELQDCMAKQLSKELGTQLQDFSTIADRYNIDKATTKLQFIVDKNGKIVQIKAVGGNNQHFSKEAQEALRRISERMIQKGKSIQPAEMNDGTKVNMNFTIPVQYMVQ
jgi:protein TonB